MFCVGVDECVVIDGVCGFGIYGLCVGWDGWFLVVLVICWLVLG